MLKRLISMSLVLLLLLLMVVAVRAEAAELTLSFAETKLTAVDSDIKALAVNGVKYVNLPFLIERLHLVTDWDPDSGVIEFRFGKSNITMKEASFEYTKDEVTDKLQAAPFEAEGELWIPVEFLLKLGLVIVKEDAKSLELDWAANYLLAIENTKYEGRPAFLLVGTAPFDVNGFLLVEPDRFGLDIKDYQAHPLFEVISDHPLVKQIRFFQFQSDTLRLVFDLNKLSGYRLISDPEKPDELLLVFNYFVEEVGFFSKDNERKVHIKTSFPSKYKIHHYVDPLRLIIDFEGATLIRSREPLPGDNEWIKGVRMSQFDSHTVRVVLDLLDDRPSFVLPAPDDPALVEVRTLQKVTGITWDDRERGGILTIESDGQLLEKVSKINDYGGLAIDLNYVQFAPELQLPQIQSDQVKQFKISQLDAATSRIELELGTWVGYTIDYSPDRRSLQLVFKESPLVGKTIVLDAGHGGVDMGATGKQGTREKQVNYDVTMRLKAYLEEAGAEVILTRNDDSFISLYERSLIANNIYADLFVSIHTNAHPNQATNGIEVYYYKGKADSCTLAEQVEAAMVKTTRLNSLGVKVNDFVVIRETQMPSILVELGFISNYEEENVIRTEVFRDNASRGICQGIINYYAVELSL